MKFKPTQQQLDVVSTFKNTRVLKVNAVAGSGKTSTLELLADTYKEPSLLLAFSKSIAVEASKRFPKHVECRTMNSLAYATHGVPLSHKLQPSKDFKVNQMRSLKDIVAWFDMSEYDMATPPISARTIASMAREAVNRFCYSSRAKISDADLHYKDFKDLEKNHVFDKDTLSKVIVKIATMIWNERKNPLSKAACTHDTYTKLWSLSKPKLNYKIVYVDESQDINPCFLSVLEQQTCKVLYVGDEYQSIFQFRGAVNAMQQIIAPTKHLSQSWRYGEAVANIAEIILSKDAVEVIGNPVIKSEITRIDTKEKYTIIFRTNFALLEKAEQLTMQGVPVSVAIELKSLITQIESAVTLRKGGKPFHDSIARFTSWNDLIDYSKEDTEMQRLVSMVLRDDVEDLIVRLKNIKDTKVAQVELTTAHKSKGFEYDNVIIADDFRFGQKHILDMSQSELNLLYVACTRAKHKLQLPCLLQDYVDDLSDI